MSSSSKKLIVLFSILLSLFAFWDKAHLEFLKEFIVLLHEYCHAIAAIISGGSVHSVSLHGNESGETFAKPAAYGGSFLFIVSSGYLGSSLIGGLLLYLGLNRINSKAIAFILGVLVLFMTFRYADKSGVTHSVGYVWGIGLILTSFLGNLLSSLIICFLGASVCLYSIYDLGDFIDGVHNTDAGIMAQYLVGYDQNSSKGIGFGVKILGYLIAGLWSILSLSTIYHFVKNSFGSDDDILHQQTPEINLQDPNLDPAALDKLLAESFPGEFPPRQNNNRT